MRHGAKVGVGEAPAAVDCGRLGFLCGREVWQDSRRGAGRRPSRVDFSLPEDHADTATGLAAGLGIRLRSPGGEGRGHDVDHPSVAGTVYPAKAPQRTWPVHYGAAFGTIELNATHYRIHPPERMADWAAGMPDDFRFCAKFPAIISHYRRFNDCVGPTDDFVAGLVRIGATSGVRPSFSCLRISRPTMGSGWWTT